MRIVITQTKIFSNQLKVWREDGTVGPMKAEMGAKNAAHKKKCLRR